MSDEHPGSSIWSTAAALTQLNRQFSRLSPDDQNLVLALVARLAQSEPSEAAFQPDVAFMDFEE